MKPKEELDLQLTLVEDDYMSIKNMMLRGELPTAVDLKKPRKKKKKV